MPLNRLLCVDVSDKPMGCRPHGSCERKYAKQVSGCFNVRKSLQVSHIKYKHCFSKHMHMLLAQFLRNRNTHVLRNRVSLLCNKLRIMSMRNESKIRLGENPRDIPNAWREQHLALSGIKPRSFG